MISLIETCLPWPGPLNGSGYGSLYWNGKVEMAHRVVYEEFKGPIPSGLQIDHLCRNRACINPNHLEAVTRSENARRACGDVCPSCLSLYEPVGTKGKRRCKPCRQRKRKERGWK